MPQKKKKVRIMKNQERNQKQISLNRRINIRFCVGIMLLIVVFFAFKTLLAYWWVLAILYVAYKLIGFVIGLAIWVIKFLIKLFMILILLGFLSALIF